MNLITLVNEYQFEMEQVKLKSKALRLNLFKTIIENRETINQEFIDKYYWETDLNTTFLANIIESKPLSSNRQLFRHVTPYQKKVYCKSCDCEMIHTISSMEQLKKFNKSNNHSYICKECEEKIQEEVRNYNLKKRNDNEEKQKEEIVNNENEINRLKTMPYKEYLQTDHWKELRKRKLQRAKYKCELCNSGGKLNVHHKTYENRGDFNREINDLIVLCEDCHAKFHDKLPKGEL